ncbi:hypothetical protein [uncultured Bacteroides sp.]|uniref:hypothetical protein n=1 Tax=uncultured Bacteroides sp. TaxID=162156 RepID=UPI002637C4DD|nr:hypothetical protein [uncultured Bacteroides sp.]
MERLSYKDEDRIDVICKYEDCNICEERCPCINEDNCPCLQEILEKLAEYEDLEEQGKLLKLPCAFGDTVYVLSPGKEYSYYSFPEDDDEKVYHLPVLTEIRKYEFEDFMISLIGKTVFLTKEAAEAALKEMSE